MGVVLKKRWWWWWVEWYAEVMGLKAEHLLEDGRGMSVCAFVMIERITSLKDISIIIFVFC